MNNNKVPGPSGKASIYRYTHYVGLVLLNVLGASLVSMLVLAAPRMIEVAHGRLGRATVGRARSPVMSGCRTSPSTAAYEVPAGPLITTRSCSL